MCFSRGVCHDQTPGEGSHLAVAAHHHLLASEHDVRGSFQAAEGVWDKHEHILRRWRTASQSSVSRAPEPAGLLLEQDSAGARVGFTVDKVG